MKLPPKLWVVQWQDSKDVSQIEVFTTKTAALDFMFDPNLCAVIHHGTGVFMYRIGVTAPLKKHYGDHA